MNADKRKKMEKLMYDCFDKLDPSKGNTKNYKDFFSQMSDAQFNTFFKKLFEDDNAYLILEVVDYERELDMVNIESAAKYLNVPLFEKVIMPHINMDTDNPSVTPYMVPVGRMLLTLNPVNCGKLLRALTTKLAS